MSYLNISQDVRQALKAIDIRELERLIDKCQSEEQSYHLKELKLYNCGPYVTQKLFYFERAIDVLSAAKSSKKHGETEYSVYKAGRDLTAAVRQMKGEISEVEIDEHTFRVDEPQYPPITFSEHLSVQVSYRWRTDKEADWQYGRITFSHLAEKQPDYLSIAPKRKLSAAKKKQEQRDKLFRTWEHLKMICVESVHQYFKEGRDGTLIPSSFKVITLDNFGAHFWGSTSN